MKSIINFYIFKFLGPSYSKQHSIFLRFLFRLSAAPYWWGHGSYRGRGGHQDHGGRGGGANGPRDGFGGGQGDLGGGHGLAV